MCNYINKYSHKNKLRLNNGDIEKIYMGDIEKYTQI